MLQNKALSCTHQQSVFFHIGENDKNGVDVDMQCVLVLWVCECCGVIVQDVLEFYIQIF